MQFKTVKLNSNWLKKDPVEFLIAVGVADVESGNANPDRVYVSKADYKKIEQNARRLLKQQYPYLSGRHMKYSLGMEMLNYGPNQSLQDAIREGYALVRLED